MEKTLTVSKYIEQYSKNIQQEEPWNNIKKLVVRGFYQQDIPDSDGYLDSQYFGRLYQNINQKDIYPSVAIGASIKDIVPKPEKLYGKKVIIQGLTSRSYIALYNLDTITKVSVLNDEDEIVEVFESNEKSKANLREYFERMEWKVPDEFLK